METAVAIAISACLLAAMFCGLVFAASRRKRQSGKGESASAGERSCPLCSSLLGPGERVKSSLFPGKADRIMHIFGCVHCWPPNPAAPRKCPACGGALSAEGWVIARYFERPGAPGGSPGRRHVHVLGCTGCRGR